MLRLPSVEIELQGAAKLDSNSYKKMSDEDSVERAKSSRYDSSSALSSRDEEDRRRRRRKDTKKRSRRRRHKRRRRSHSSDSSDDDSSSYYQRKRRKTSKSKKERRKKKKKKASKKERRQHDSEHDEGTLDKHIQAPSKDLGSVDPPTESIEFSNDDADQTQADKKDDKKRQEAARKMVPMSKEQYEAERSKIREVYDPESGRYRLVRGTGEIIERIVSRDDHQRINQTATRGDGASFSRSVYAATRR